jgi:regulatory protein
MSEFTSPPPDAAALNQAAMNYIARYAATQAAVRRMLQRRIDRWVRLQTDADAASTAAAPACAAINPTIEKLIRLGVLSDEAFATSRAGGLRRAGASSRAVQQRLIAKGIDIDLAQAAASTDPEAELAAALVLVRRRRLGHFGTVTDDPAQRARHLAILARAGFSRDTAERALKTDVQDAEARIFALRQT